LLIFRIIIAKIKQYKQPFEEGFYYLLYLSCFNLIFLLFFHLRHYIFIFFQTFLKVQM